MRWKVRHLPGFKVSRQTRAFTFDDWETTYSWDSSHDEEVADWLNNTTVKADEQKEAVDKFARKLPRCVVGTDETDGVDAMMGFMQGSHHRDPNRQIFEGLSGQRDVSDELDVRKRTMRVTEGRSPVETGEINEVQRGISGIINRVLKALSRLTRS